MIPNRKGWHYLEVIKLSALLRGMTFKHQGDFCCLNFLFSFATENKLEFHKNVWENKDFYNVIMPSKDTKILELNQYQKSDKALFIIYADLGCIIEKIDECKNNPENPSTRKVNKYIPLGFSMSKCLHLEA